MKLRKFVRDERGQVLPIVTIVLALFALGFIALVVDAGVLYVQRKAMVTSADAAALAGAKVLEESKGGSISEAQDVAIEYAKLNGADEDQIEVEVTTKNVNLPSGETENRLVVDVTVGKNQPLIFARFLGDDDTDVRAQAVATWGYVKKSYVGEFIPLFTFDTDYQLNTDIYLHEKIEDSNNGYGFIDIGTGMGGIKKAIAGDIVGGSFIYNNYLDGEPGAGESLVGAVESRMKLAQNKSTTAERKNTMIGLVPVIDRAAFMSLPVNDSGNANKWKLPIKYFAYFEILDIVRKNGIEGSQEALDPSNEYNKVATPFTYTDIPETMLKNGKLESSLLVGRFTGTIVEAKTLVEAGDQIDPNPGGDPPATYSKLIK